MFNRERFLMWVFAALLTWQAGLFTYGTVKCTGAKNPLESCPQLGERYEKFVNTSLGAVLGLLGGAAVATTVNRSRKE